MSRTGPLLPLEPADYPDSDDTSASDISLGAMDDKLGFHLWLAHSIFGRDLTGRLAKVGLTPRQCMLLTLIDANPGTSQVALGGLLETDRATMMGLVDRLEDSGFIERRRSTVDRRRQELYVTAAGRATLVRAEEQMARNEAQAGHRVLAPAERTVLIELLRRIHERGVAPL